ncbi:hypothetical protein [Methanospirillum lacunae]|uniref:Uncharacterized protein n=1 Tax=Methanospirillum lacunae TaxID=668570 RepID=A0A2V2NBB4_9EURY|nr:hypothetical protein [Methanospirillum lacunae]PWR72583.1 hypothetical protein DK846_06350 [Methanospirillum lacunae]
MNHLFLFCCVVVLGFVASGCALADNETPLVAGKTLATLSNDQPEISLPLDSGIFIVSFQALEPQTMKFNQNTKDSWSESTELKIVSPYNGSIAFAIPKPGDCTINISSTGSWTAQVNEYDLASPVKAPVNLSGSGTTVTQPITLEKGEYFFQRGETGESSPSYYLTSSNGSYVMDETNSYVLPGFSRISTEPFKIVTITESGTYFLSVMDLEENPKAWNMSISSVPPAPVMGPGPVIRETV